MHSNGAPNPALELRSVTAGYDRVEVLHDVSFLLPQGKIFALLGPNGAGKSTTLKVASGRLPVTKGAVLVDGTDQAGRRPDVLARSGLCSVPEGRAVFPNLTVEENLKMWTYRGGVSTAQVTETTFARFPQLAGRRKQLAGSLSGGEQQMLAMSRALSTSPRLLLLDEISMGLAPLVVARLYEAIAEIATEGRAIVIVEQFASMALRVADLAAVMSGGRVELQGSPDEVRSGLADVYLRRTKVN
jgi:branched-chain amino acid transport system ATP-binding protein